MNQIVSVRQLTEQLRRAVEQRFPYLWVRGEVTNLSRPGSGHLYFSLREGDDHLPCVWFGRQQRAQDLFDPLTGEVLADGPRPSLAQTLENGQEIVCAGRISVYGPRGSYQLIVDLAQGSGLGRYYLAFEELKLKLAARGYFDSARKRKLPINPARVALITALSGAAVHDFIKVSSSRGLSSVIRIHPSLVQGEGSVQSLIAALAEANRQDWAEVIVLIRGGGSIQDLQAFNSEDLAMAVVESPLPVLTGVGHEIDHSIVDFVADFSAATPSHAAQLLWSERREFAQLLDERENALDLRLKNLLDNLGWRLDHVEEKLALVSPSMRLRNQEETLKLLALRLEPVMGRNLQGHMAREAQLADRLRIRSGRLLEGADANLLVLERKLRTSGALFGKELSHTLEQAALTLEAVSPLAPLARGYALIRNANEETVRSVKQTRSGEELELLVLDGRIKTEVRDIFPAKEQT